jgi:hypothetical protein
MPNPYRKGDTVPYRSLDARAWRVLAVLPADSLRLILHCWFSDHSTPFGIVDLPDAYIEHDLGWRTPRLRRAWSLLEERGLVIRDGRLIALPLFLSCNVPSNPKVLAGWRTAINRLPDSPIFKKLYQSAFTWVTEEGLAWLQPKANIGPISKGYPKPTDTLSNSGAVAGAERKEQEQERGECERGDPTGDRSASPLDAASLAPPDVGSQNGTGEPPAALEGENKNSRDGKAKLRRALLSGVPERFLIRSGYTMENINAGRIDSGIPVPTTTKGA